MKNNLWPGRLGMLGIWVTAGFAIPLVNHLREFSPEQLMMFRGLLTAFIAFVWLQGRVGYIDKFTWLSVLVLPLATFGLYQGIRSWGAGPTIVVITATPVVNIIIGVLSGRKLEVATLVGLILLLGGVAIALRGGEFNWHGLLWSSFGAVMNGFLYELFARATSSPVQKCFYSCVGMGLLGLILSHSQAIPEVSSNIWLALGFFAFVGGFLYWVANAVAFKYLPPNEASVLAQVEAPAVIIGAYFILGEELELMSWLGVGISLFGAGYLSYWLSRKTEDTK